MIYHDERWFMAIIVTCCVCVCFLCGRKLWSVARPTRGSLFLLSRCFTQRRVSAQAPLWSLAHRGCYHEPHGADPSCRWGPDGRWGNISRFTRGGLEPLKNSGTPKSSTLISLLGFSTVNQAISGWWFGTRRLFFSYIWNDVNNWPIFLMGVEITNQKKLRMALGASMRLFWVPRIRKLELESQATAIWRLFKIYAPPQLDGVWWIHTCTTAPTILLPTLSVVIPDPAGLVLNSLLPGAILCWIL